MPNFIDKLIDDFIRFACFFILILVTNYSHAQFNNLFLASGEIDQTSNKTYYSYDFLKKTNIEESNLQKQAVEMITLLKNNHNRLHQREYINNSIWQDDITKLNELHRLAQENATEKINTYNEKIKATKARKKEKLKRSDLQELKEVSLSPKNPFIRMEISLDEKINPQDLSQVHELLKSPEYKWYLACIPQTTVITNNDKSNPTVVSSKIICLSPVFRSKFLDPRTRDPLYLIVPSICLAAENVQQQTRCSGDFKLSNEWHLTFPKLKIKIAPGKRDLNTNKYASEKAANKPTLNGGMKLQVIDALTRKPIENAAIFLDKQNFTTDANGVVTIRSINLRANSSYLTASHRWYEPGQKQVTIGLDQMTDNGILPLEPKKVRVVGNVKSIGLYKFDHNLANKAVTISGYGKIFKSITDQNGSFSFENVPVVLTDVHFNDVTESFENEFKKISLDVDTENKIEIPINPLLTTVTGTLRDSVNNLVENFSLQIHVKGSSSYKLTTDKNGEFISPEVPLKKGEITLELNTSDPRYQISEAIIPIEISNNYGPNPQTYILTYMLNIYQGYVNDVRSKIGIANVEVKLFNKKNKLLATTYTDENGHYEIKDIVGGDHVVLSHYDYIAEREMLPPHKTGTIVDADFYMLQTAFSNQTIAVVLSWGAEQSDLDAQIFSPEGDHIYFKTLGIADLSTKVGATLDTDDKGISGRETTKFLLTNQGNTTLRGTYRFMVYQYGSKNLGFISNEAKIKIYQNGAHAKDYRGKKIESITGSKDAKYLWDVFSIIDGKIHIVNQFPAENESKALEETTIRYTKKSNDYVELLARFKIIKDQSAAEITKQKIDIAVIDQKILNYKTKWDELEFIRKNLAKFNEAKNNKLIEMADEVDASVSINVESKLQELTTQEAKLVEEFKGPKSEILAKKANYELLVEELNTAKNIIQEQLKKSEQTLEDTIREEKLESGPITLELIALKAAQNESSKNLFEAIKEFK